MTGTGTIIKRDREERKRVCERDRKRETIISRKYVRKSEYKEFNVKG